jgi:hypothetical protein
MFVLKLFGLIMKIPFKIVLEGLMLHLAFTDAFAFKGRQHLPLQQA